MSDYHTPVLVADVLEGLQVAPGKRYIDATLGGGGHTKEIVRLGGIVLGIDTDTEAIEENTETAWKVVQGNFRDIERIAREHGFDSVNGILFDLGVSSHQLNTPERGFSYRFGEAPLDLRLDQRKGVPASVVVQKSSEEELYEIFAKFGEEKHARTIAHTLVSARSVTPIETTGDLVDIVGRVPGIERLETLSRIFQALRIVVNDELGALKEGIRGAEKLLVSGGRLVVISFHSLEDRIVKLALRGPAWRVITKKPIEAGRDEVFHNRRSRSAKLRIAEKV